MQGERWGGVREASLHGATLAPPLLTHLHVVGWVGLQGRQVLSGSSEVREATSPPNKVLTSTIAASHSDISQG